MLQVASKFQASSSAAGELFSSAESFRHTLAIARRQLFPVLAVVLSVFLLAGIYLATTLPKYTATATMVIDTNNKLNQQQSIMSDAVVDSTSVETQVEVLKSDNVAHLVIKKLNLAQDPEFVGAGGGVLAMVVGSIMKLLPHSSTAPEGESEQVLKAFRSMANIRRSGLTYAISISFTSLRPGRAAKIANAIAEAYVDDQMDSRLQATQRAGIWLQGRIVELRGQVLAAEQAVQDFKDQNNIVDAGGRLVTEQQLAEVNSQLIMARAQTSEAKAKLDRIEELLTGNGSIPDADVSDSLRSEVITKLRNEYLQLSGREGLWANQYGKGHQAVVNLRKQMDELRRSMLNELARIGGSFKSEYEIASAREQSLQASLEKVTAQSQSTKQSQIKLRELQSNAQVHRNLYDTLLQRHMEAVQQQSVPITEARVISPASPPNKKSSPSTVIVLATTVLASGLLGAGIALFRELCDRVFRTSSQVEQGLHVPCLGMLPTISEAREARKRPIRRPKRTALLAYAVDNPLSRYTECLRALRLACDFNVPARTTSEGSPAQGRVIAFTSTIPKEGKSTVAANFARLMAPAGTILVDADLRQPSLSRQLVPNAKAGLVEVITGNSPIRDVIHLDELTDLHILPASGPSELPAPSSDVIGSTGMKRLIEFLRHRYNYVVIDLPPLAPAVDVQATIDFVDSYMYVIEWGRTPADLVLHHLGRSPTIHDRLLGVILNKANTRQLNHYEKAYGSSQYTKLYSRYRYAA
jgi:succinoglycan biosynthesis transport protein ExoP